MDTKKKLKIGFSTLVIVAFMTVGTDLTAGCKIKPGNNDGFCRPDIDGNEVCLTLGPGTACAGNKEPTVQ